MSRRTACAIVLSSMLHAAALRADQAVQLSPQYLGHAPTVEEFQPEIAFTGRINTIAVHPTDDGQAIAASDSGGLFKTSDGGQTWSHLDNFPCFLTNAVAYWPKNPQVLIATSGRDFKTTNGGGIWRSTNGGQTWEQPATAAPPAGAFCPNRPLGYGISIEPRTGVIYVATDCGVSKSGDGGATWSHTSAPPSQAVEALGGKRVVAGGGNGFWYSTDGGSSWNMEGTGIGGTSAIHALSRSPASTSQVFAENSAYGLFVSEDGGKNWTKIPKAPPGGGACGGIEFVKVTRGAHRVSPHVVKKGLFLYFGNTCSPYRLFIGQKGASFSYSGPWMKLQPAHADVRDLAFTKTGIPLFMASDGGLAKTNDNGFTWYPAGGGAAGLNALQVTEIAGQRVNSSSRYDLYLSTQDNQIRSSDDNGQSWEYATNGEGFFLSMERRVASEADARAAYTGCGDCVSYLSDAHFANETDWPDADPQHGSPVIMSEGIYVETDSAGLGLTKDFGVSWTHIADIPEPKLDLPKLSWDGDNPVLYQAVRTGDNAGHEVVTLARVSNFISDGAAAAGTTLYPQMNNFGSIGVHPTMFAWYEVFAVDPQDPMHLIAPDMFSQSMKESWDGGDNWSEIPGLTDKITRSGQFMFRFDAGSVYFPLVTAVSFYPDDPNYVLLGTAEAGIYFSQDRGATWTYVAGSDKLSFVGSFHWQSASSVLVSSYGRGLWKLRTRSSAALERLQDICGARCLVYDLRRELSGVTLPDPPDYDQALLVFDGRVTNVAVSASGSLEQIGVTPGATFVGFGDSEFRSSPAELAEYGSFAGLEDAKRLIEEGRTIRGVALKDNVPRYLLYGSEQYTLQFPGQVLPFVAAGNRSSGLADRAYVKLTGGSSVGGTSIIVGRGKLVLTGQGFTQGRPVTVKVDGKQIKSKGVRVREGGSFSTKLTVKAAIGWHTVNVTQKTRAGIVSKSTRFLSVPGRI